MWHAAPPIATADNDLAAAVKGNVTTVEKAAESTSTSTSSDPVAPKESETGRQSSSQKISVEELICKIVEVIMGYFWYLLLLGVS